MRGVTDAGPSVESVAGRGTVAVDFDGLICPNWSDSDRALDPPVPGSVAALESLKSRGFNILVLSSRPESAVKMYLETFGIPYDLILAGAGRKPFFRVLIDDRGIGFDGSWSESVRQINAYEEKGTI